VGKEYRGYRDLIGYQLSFNLAVEIFNVSKTFPKEEKFSLIDQIRRSSHSVSANIAEAWGKRKYPKYFVLKLTDSIGEAYETEVWLNFAFKHGYFQEDKHRCFVDKYQEVCRILFGMINKPEKFCVKKEQEF
jgi:four helix bundle protein